jgi:hypothetical protein
VVKVLAVQAVAVLVDMLALVVMVAVFLVLRLDVMELVAAVVVRQKEIAVGLDTLVVVELVF